MKNGITIIIYIFGSLILAQLIPPNDPIYNYMRQKFRDTHNLNIFIKPYPWSFADYKEIKLYPHYNENELYIRFIPSIKVFNNIPIVRFDVWASHTWGNFSILAEPILINESYGERELGESYKRAGITGKYENGYIQYSTQNITIQLGRKPVWWGQSWESSIIKSGHSPPYNHATLLLEFKDFQLELLTGQLHSGRVDSIGRFKRFIGGKKFTYISKSSKYLLAVGDLILYTGVNRSVEWQYINPVIPFIFSDLENDAGENDNNMIFIYGRGIINSTLSTYFELLVDDFQIDIENRDKIQDGLGFKMGFDGTRTVKNKKFGFEVEYTRISGYTYLAREWFTNWEERGIPIGYKYGPDCQSLFFLLEYWYNSNLLFSFSNEYLEKGELILSSQYDPYDKVGDPFPSGNVKYNYYIYPSLSWHSKYGILEIGLDGDLQDAKQNSFYLRAQIVLGMGYDL